ncbi:hypothetical protein CPLU01_03361 [Colletotrichum plurivorum]|uniref:Uncharacterized protein n=1 Tax=Colletotrichum plurivorum TaxID=2175906 RepID=A0A8H6KST0_9PEZI|nr:hypothetical protein CPLU01_03361 [Colletotrichum plurivorum]
MASRKRHTAPKECGLEVGFVTQVDRFVTLRRSLTSNTRIQSKSVSGVFPAEAGKDVFGGGPPEWSPEDP